MNTAGENMVQVKIMLPENDWYSFKAETIWATPLGDNLYRVENPPFFADNISYLDVVFAWHDTERNWLIFKSVRQRSGNSTFRIILGDDSTYETFCAGIAPALEMGCTYENIKNHQFALNVPAGVDIKSVTGILNKGQTAGVWYFEPSHIFNDKEVL
ncbi:MAG TPA: DUF4265 domain-containing protein [Chitinophagaceae bacterium]|nr:DUF4265 domain-containing protein [Chitinophagaceae bacterium]